MMDIYIVLKIDEIQEILIADRDKRNNLSTNYNRGVNIIGIIHNCFGVTAIGLGINGVGILSTIVTAPAVNGIKAVSIFMEFFWVVGNRAIKKMTLKIKKTTKRWRCSLFEHLTLSAVSYERHYQMTPFQMKNIN